jgi:hypothetical protein
MQPPAPAGKATKDPIHAADGDCWDSSPRSERHFGASVRTSTGLL